MKIFKASRCSRWRSRTNDCEPEPPYDSEPIFDFPATCRFCSGKGCIMCEEQPSIRAARLPDMTIRGRP
jgi:hypothetical protein